jgi:hypothetical protein
MSTTGVLPRIAIWFGLAALSAACESLEPSPAPASASHGVVAAQFSDLPVPKGMRLLQNEHRSHSLQQGDYRFAELWYEGSSPLLDVSTYMQDRMRDHNWEPIAVEAPAPDVQNLKWKRGMYLAECTLSRENALTLMKVTLRTEIAKPQSQPQQPQQQ